MKPSGDSFERPFVCDVVDQENALSPPRVGTDDCAEPALTARVPQLKFDTLPINQNYRGFVSCKRGKSRGPLLMNIILLSKMNEATILRIPITNEYKTNTVPIGYSDLGYSGRAGYSDRNPCDGPPSVHK